MNAYNTAALESAVTDDCTDLTKRDARALTEKMIVLPDAERVSGADDLFLVVSESGSEYLVDTRDGVCECPDYRYREPEDGCKHIKRCRFALGEKTIPAWADTDAIDPRLGKHTRPGLSEVLHDVDAKTEPIQTDGGVSAETVADEGPNNNEVRYTYHHEPAHVGGERYARCTDCGAECVPAKPDQMAHREGCSEGER